jgi:hypothetical protein
MLPGGVGVRPSLDTAVPRLPPAAPTQSIPWAVESWADVIVQVLYITANVLCVGFEASSLSEAGFEAVSLSEAGVRAAHLSLVNMAPAFAGPHLTFLADMLGVSLGTFRHIHRSAGVVSVLLLAFHITTVVAARTPFPLQVAQNMWALVVCAPSLDLSPILPIDKT